ncbi:acyl-CoA N-acyltransferase [Abortiporus biennis]|nr:acyl-CoA N-acyltransferase [Abortiporus biennis]
MTGLRIVHFTNPDDFLKATIDHDDSSLNFALGSVLESRNEEGWVEKKRLMIGVYNDDTLTVTFTKIENDFAWLLSNALGIDQQIEPETLTKVTSALVAFLPSVVDPKKIDNVFGAEDLVNDFTAKWADWRNTNGANVKVVEYMQSRAASVTLATLPPTPARIASHQVSQANPTDDLEELARLYVEFTKGGPHVASMEEGKRVMQEGVKDRGIWICKSNGEVAGYVRVGRRTPRTAAIRNVFVHPEHRRKGIAEAMVLAVSRYYLEGEAEGKKKEVSLNVGRDDARRLYTRCGFMLEDNAKDPSTGKRGWYSTSWRGIEDASSVTL